MMENLNQNQNFSILKFKNKYKNYFKSKIKRQLDSSLYFF